MSSFEWPPSGSGSGSTVTSINGLTGAVTLAAGANITLTPSGNTITIAAGGGGGSAFDTIGTFDTGTPTTDGLNASGTTLFAQSADATNPGMVNTGAQTLAGDKTFTGHLINSSLTANRAVITSTGGLFTTSPTTSAELAFVNGVTSSIQTQLNGKQATLTIGDLTDTGTDGIIITGGVGSVIGSGTSIAQHVADSTHNGYLLSTDWVTFNAKQAAGNYITALTGDGTASGPGSVALTLATVNGNVGSFGSSTSIPSITVNAKGLITAASGNAVIAPAGTLTGTTLASNVVSSSLTSVGTLTSGTWNATTIDVAHGGTGQTSYTNGQLLIGNTSGNTLTKATLTQGAGITITNGSGAITIAATGSVTPPTVQKFTSGSGTYTLPTSPSPLYIKVELTGGGGGGCGSGTVIGTGGTSGGNSTFGTSLLVANGGSVNNAIGGSGGSGGTVSLGTGPIGIGIAGGSGGGGAGTIATNGSPGGMGGSGAYGGGGGGGPSGGSGVDAAANSGGGGGGGGGNSVAAGFSGPGGGSGGTVQAIITSPSSTYAYAVGAGGTAGGAGTNGRAGGNGGSGFLVVWEYY